MGLPDAFVACPGSMGALTLIEERQFTLILGDVVDAGVRRCPVLRIHEPTLGMLCIANKIPLIVDLTERRVRTASIRFSSPGVLLTYLSQKLGRMYT
jgi:hypothetical protein